MIQTCGPGPKKSVLGWVRVGVFSRRLGQPENKNWKAVQGTEFLAQVLHKDFEAWTQPIHSRLISKGFGFPQRVLSALCLSAFFFFCAFYFCAWWITVRVALILLYKRVWASMSLFSAFGPQEGLGPYLFRLA